jgi:hypothetical protein
MSSGESPIVPARVFFDLPRASVSARADFVLERISGSAHRRP